MSGLSAWTKGGKGVCPDNRCEQKYRKKEVCPDNLGERINTRRPAVFPKGPEQRISNCSVCEQRPRDAELRGRTMSGRSVVGMGRRGPSRVATPKLCPVNRYGAPFCAGIEKDLWRL